MPGHIKAPASSFPGKTTTWPAPATCAACIEAAGGAPQGIRRMLAAPAGEAVGLNVGSSREMKRWLEAQGGMRCPCLPPLPGYWVPGKLLRNRETCHEEAPVTEPAEP